VIAGTAIDNDDNSSYHGNYGLMAEKTGKRRNSHDRFTTQDAGRFTACRVTEHEEDQFKHSNAGEYVADMYYPLETIAGIENNNHSDSSNFMWLSSGIDKLRSQFGFNIEES